MISTIFNFSLNRNSVFSLIFLLLIYSPFSLHAQQGVVEKSYHITTGDGWYRIAEGTFYTSSKIRIHGINDNNKVTDLTFHVSTMGFEQGGNITIVNNQYYNQNHIDKIRCGTNIENNTRKYVVDIHLVNLDGDTDFKIEAENRVSLVDAPIFNPLPLSEKGLVSISGKSLGIMSSRYPIYLGDKVGIGTTNLGSWKLAVNGKIKAKEIKVFTDWADFVFSDAYNLPTLEEVEAHIKEKRHLKDIPSAKQVATNGILLGEMNSKLLQKIEELTLYTIEQQKAIKSIEEMNEKLQKQNLELVTQIQQIKAQL